MNILTELRSRFRTALDGLIDDPTDLLDMIRPSQDSKFGDYQANCAMPLGNRLGKPPRDIAASIIERLDVADMCDEPEIAGPGFINLRLKTNWLIQQLARMVGDQRLDIQTVEQPRTFVIDYSSPNVAKPMHVGHIRSTVIGDALTRTLRFLGHKVISDNHLGDWGTQFGMIIYGYKHFVDREAFANAPVAELTRLYKYVNRLIDYHNAKTGQPSVEESIIQRAIEVAEQQSKLATGDKTADKKARKALPKLVDKLCETCVKRDLLKDVINSVETDQQIFEIAKKHKNIAQAVLDETAKLHAGDEENLRLWHEFLPHCRNEIERVYQRLDIEFDYEHGESFYHDRLADVVATLQGRNIATESEGAICVFMDGFDTPMIVRKKDGAFLYATTDLATIQHRMEDWHPDAILYVVDHRQSEHFEKLFAAAKLLGYDNVEFQHVRFGTVMGEDGKPYKTRSGDTVGLEGLLDDAVARALQVVSENDDRKPTGPELSQDDRQHVADVVGHAAIKYSDLSHNRTSDYMFSWEKMLAMQGNTGAYMQYSYARMRSIFAKGEIDIESLRSSGKPIELGHPMERALAMELVRFHQALDDTVEDYRPNQLTSYLFTLADSFNKFYDKCKVLKAETDESRDGRLLLCDLTGRTIKQGLALLGISVVNKM